VWALGRSIAPDTPLLVKKGFVLLVRRGSARSSRRPRIWRYSTARSERGHPEWRDGTASDPHVRRHRRMVERRVCFFLARAMRTYADRVEGSRLEIPPSQRERARYLSRSQRVVSAGCRGCAARVRALKILILQIGFGCMHPCSCASLPSPAGH
jgi:hypothetical protein